VRSERGGRYKFLSGGRVHSKVHDSKGPSSNLPFQNIMIHSPHTIIFLKLGIQCLLIITPAALQVIPYLDWPGSRMGPAMMSRRTTRPQRRCHRTICPRRVPARRTKGSPIRRLGTIVRILIWNIWRLLGNRALKWTMSGSGRPVHLALQSDSGVSEEAADKGLGGPGGALLMHTLGRLMPDGHVLR
jgi:hypothetical protein